MREIVGERFKIIQGLVKKDETIKNTQLECEKLIEDLEYDKEVRLKEIKDKYDKSMSNIIGSVDEKIESIEITYSQKIDDVDGILLEIHSKYGKMEDVEIKQGSSEDIEYKKRLEDMMVELYSRFVTGEERSTKVNENVVKAKTYTGGKIKELYEKMLFKHKMGVIASLIFVVYYMYKTRALNIPGVITIVVVILMIFMGGIKYKKAGVKVGGNTKELYGVVKELRNIYIQRMERSKKEIETKLSIVENKIKIDREREINDAEEYIEIEKDRVKNHYKEVIENIDKDIAIEVGNETGTDICGVNTLAELYIRGNNIDIYDNRVSTIINVEDRDKYYEKGNILLRKIVRGLLEIGGIGEFSFVDTRGLGNNFIDLVEGSSYINTGKIYTDNESTENLIDRAIHEISNRLQRKVDYSGEEIDVIVIQDLNDIGDECIYRKVSKIVEHGYSYGVYVIILGSKIKELIDVESTHEGNIIEIGEEIFLKSYGKEKTNIKIKGNV